VSSSSRRFSSRIALPLTLAAAALLAISPAAAARPAASNIRPDNFVLGVDNPWFPLWPGTTYVYRGVRNGQPIRDVVTVTRQTKQIEGVRCTAVSDRVYAAGRLAERTTDWYAQDKAGNVWYFGEATAELNATGKVKNTEGSWQAGVNGAKAGIQMPAHPRVGERAREEFLKGHAEDHFEVLSLSSTVRTPAASSRHGLLTKEWTPLEPGVIDHKLYVRGIGTVKEETVRGGVERASLVVVRRSG
jgi:hypothetical protein